MQIRVAIVEDITEIREGLALFLDSSEGFACVGMFADGKSALAGLAATKPDVVLMDIHLPDISGVECVQRLKPQLPDTQFMMCTVYEEHEHIFNSLKAGATGYMLKKTPPEQLLQAVREIHNGGSPMTGTIARKIITTFQPAEPTAIQASLTQRESDILTALSKGLRYKEIADQHFISIDTVRTHIRRIYEKLQVHSRTEALNKVFPK
jgi:DNA-binding NarL/FixJ family response regulator